MKRCGMYKFFRAVMWIEIEILGLEQNKGLAPMHKRASKLVLFQVLKGGNFGHQYDHNHKQAAKEVFGRQMLYNLQYAIEFPSEPLLRPITLAWDYLTKRFYYKTTYLWRS